MVLFDSTYLFGINDGECQIKNIVVAILALALYPINSQL